MMKRYEYNNCTMLEGKGSVISLRCPTAVSPEIGLLGSEGCSVSFPASTCCLICGYESKMSKQKKRKKR